MKIKFSSVIITSAMLVVLELTTATNSSFAFNPEHLRRLIQSGECQNCDLSNADLSGQNLEGNNFNGSNLQGANLRGANLTQADLTKVDLSGADLTGANLRQVTLWRSILRDVDLRNANLQRASLLGNDLRGMNLQGINLQDANLDNVNLQGANLTGANLRGARFTEVNLRGATLTGADIRDTSATNVNTEGAIGLNPNNPRGRTSSPNPENRDADRQISDQPGEMAALRILAFTSYGQRDYASTITYANQTLAIARSLEDKELEWQMLTLLGNAYYDRADYLKAVEIFRQTLIFRDHLGASAANSGRANLAVGDFAAAIEDSEYAMASGNPQTRAMAFNTLAATNRILGQNTQALDYAQQALESAQMAQDQNQEQEALLNLAEAHQILGAAVQARSYVDQGLAMARQLADQRREAKARKTQGSILNEQGDYGGAIVAYQASLSLSREVGDKRLQAEVLQGLGTTQKNAGDLPGAATSLRDSLELWAELRRVFVGNEYFQMSFDELQSQTFRLLQEVYIAQNQPEAALEVVEQSRTRTFIQTATAKLATTVSPPGIDRIKAIARERNATLVTYSIRDRCRDVFQFCRGINSRTQKYLQESQLYIWVVKPTGEITFQTVELAPLLKPQNITLDNLVVNSREGIGIRGLDNKLDHKLDHKLTNTQQVKDQQVKDQQVKDQQVKDQEVKDQEVKDQQPRPKNRQLQSMYQLLIAPIADQLPQNPEDQVIFIPQGALFMVPFSALQDEDGKYLIEKHTLVSTPSLSVLEVTQKQRQARGRFSLSGLNALIVGNPTMPLLRLNDEEDFLPELPGAEIEAKAIAPLFQTQALIGSQATKNEVLRQMPTAGIIHLATHAILEDSIDVYGVIAVAPEDPKVGSTGLIHAQEILNLNLQAQLVVLSACNTARGKISGDGVAGLARSFIAAGSPTVIASIWSVPDAPTATLMTSFYQNLAQNPHIAQALRQAMLSTMTKFPQPKDWAVFTLIGEAN